MYTITITAKVLAESLTDAVTLFSDAVQHANTPGLVGLGLGDTTVKVNADPLDSCSWPYVARVAFKVARDNSGQACAVVDEAIASHTKSNRVRVVDITVKGERGA